MCTLNVTIMQAAGLEAAQGSFLRYRLVSSSTLTAPPVDVNSLGRRRFTDGHGLPRADAGAAGVHRCRRRSGDGFEREAPPRLRVRLRASR